MPKNNGFMVEKRIPRLFRRRECVKNDIIKRYFWSSKLSTKSTNKAKKEGQSTE
jgi:hypothetical protein